MVYRCTVKTHKQFRDYGGRGITVCDRWKRSFSNFLHDMGARPKGMYLDRKNNDLGYSPSNCKWSTPTESANNTRRNRLIECGGITLTMSEWSRRQKIPLHTISYRINSKRWSIERALEFYV
jgi:hypothetical protein